MSNPIKEVENLLLGIGQELQLAKLRAWVSAANKDEAVFEEAWRLATRRASDGTCPCCGNMVRS